MKREVLPEKEFAPTVADEIVTSILEVLEEQDRCSICLSGGTTPAAIYRLLGLPPRFGEVPWKRISFYWGDERFVPAEDARNNSRMVHDTLLHQFRNTPLPSVYPIDTSKGSAAAAAADYEQVLLRSGLFREKGKGFDIVLLGVGEDGHIASLFPQSKGESDKPEHELSPERLVVSCHHPTDGSERITLTPRALFAGPRVFFLVTGAAKQPIVERIFSHPELSPQEIPALYSKDAAGEVLWFIDQHAGGDL